MLNNTVAACGGGILAYGAIMGACIVGGIFEGVLGMFLKPLRKFFPAIVTGSVVIAIGLSLLGWGLTTSVVEAEKQIMALCRTCFLDL